MGCGTNYILLENKPRTHSEVFTLESFGVGIFAPDTEAATTVQGIIGKAKGESTIAQKAQDELDKLSK